MATRTVASVAGRSSSTRFKSPPACPSTAVPLARPAPQPGLRLLPARTGDHPKIHGLLLSVFHGPSPAEFHAQLEEPGYEASDRLVVKDDDEIAAHVRLARQAIRIGSATAPAVRFMDLATAPEYRGRGLASALLAAGERAARQRGALVALTRTRVASLFADQGWSLCGQHVYSTAAPRSVLAELSADQSRSELASKEGAAFFQPRPEPISVRPLRRIELDAVMRLYERNQSGHCGSPVRSEAYWEWLLARGACDRIYVAAKGSEPGSIAELLAAIVGYAFVRQSRIVELVTAPEAPEAAQCLTARVCADACEHSDGHLRCDLALGDPLHDLIVRSGGKLHASRESGGEVFMARLLDPLAVLRRMQGDLAARACGSALELPDELGIEVRCSASGTSSKPGVVERYILHLGKRSPSIQTGGPSRHRIIVRENDLAPLLLGSEGALELERSHRLRCTTAAAKAAANCLFPGHYWWRPALDDLLA